MRFPAPSHAQAPAPASRFIVTTLEGLTIDDEASFRHVGLYADLKRALQEDGYRFRVLPEAQAGRWDRAVALNLTFWGADDGGDVLVDSHIPADVVAHVAWHHLTARALGAVHEDSRASADVLFLGESIASAFDVYLVGRLLGHAPQSSFLESQVPAMADAASEAGLDEEAFEALLAGIAADPDRAFDDLRALLFDAARALVGCKDAEEALAVLSGLDSHRFGPILHRYELSNWVLYARAYATAVPDTRVQAVDRALREGNGLEWLTREWIDPPRATT
jgi:hypothetical protein